MRPWDWIYATVLAGYVVMMMMMMMMTDWHDVLLDAIFFEFLYRSLILNYINVIGSYKELHEWSVNNYAEFWEECFRFFDVVHSAPYSQVWNIEYWCS